MWYTNDDGKICTLVIEVALVIVVLPELLNEKLNGISEWSCWAIKSHCFFNPHGLFTVSSFMVSIQIIHVANEHKLPQH